MNKNLTTYTILTLAKTYKITQKRSALLRFYPLVNIFTINLFCQYVIIPFE